MVYFLAVQNSYQAIELALFNNQTILAQLSLDKHDASKLLIPSISHVLASHNLALKDLSFITVNQGPGPFTTLRVVITTVNGISFAAGTPLIGIDGLSILLEEHHTATFPITVALLNAFNFDVYFGIDDQSQQTIKTGYKNIYALLDELAAEFPTQELYFIGNGITMYKAAIIAKFGQRAVIPTPLPEFSSIKQLGLTGLEYWKAQKNIGLQVQPLYLKQFSAVMNPFIQKSS